MFCSPDCVGAWLTTSNPRGCVMDLPTLWRLASGWYTGRLSGGYVRRDPSQVADHVRTWGL